MDLNISNYTNDKDDEQVGDSIFENDEFEVHNKLSLKKAIIGR
jgi:hypothetical protein